MENQVVAVDETADILQGGPPITLPAFARAGLGMRHFFGTRPRAFEGPWQNGRRGGGPGSHEALQGLRRRAGGQPGTTAIAVRQVHGTDVLVLDRPVRPGEVFRGGWDAIVTDQPQVLLTVRTADCVPLLLYDATRRVVAAVHAGWRGAIAGILPRTLERMRRRFGSSPPALFVGIGPSVGPCCYEVDAPVLERLRDRFADWHAVITETGRLRARLDLRELVRRQAEQEGVRAERITTVRACTVCHPDLFYSYRREGCIKGTMVSGIMLVHRTSRG